jgi:hypothetical protein
VRKLTCRGIFCLSTTCRLYVVRAAEDVFELKDGALTPKDGQSCPGDPWGLLTPHVWLGELERDEPYLFTPAPDASELRSSSRSPTMALICGPPEKYPLMR